MAYKKGSKEAMQNRQRLLPSAPFEPDLNDGNRKVTLKDEFMHKVAPR
jgi:hypothetical protein